jgi:hypothetical protein
VTNPCYFRQFLTTKVTTAHWSCGSSTRDHPLTTREIPVIMAEEYNYQPKDVADTKSPGWRYRCNANGVSMAGTWVGIKGC